MLVALKNLGLGKDMGQVMAVGYERDSHDNFIYLWRKVMDVEDFVSKYSNHQLIRVSKQPKIDNPNEWILAIHFYDHWGSLKLHPNG